MSKKFRGVVVTVKLFCNAEKCRGMFSVEACKNCLAINGLFAPFQVSSVVPSEERQIKIRNIKEAVEYLISYLQKSNFKVGRVEYTLQKKHCEIMGVFKPFESPYAWRMLELHVIFFRNPFWSFPKWLRENRPDAPQEDYAPAVSINLDLLKYASSKGIDLIVYVTEDARILAIPPREFREKYVEERNYVRKKPLKSKQGYEWVAHAPITALKPISHYLHLLKELIHRQIQEKQ